MTLETLGGRVSCTFCFFFIIFPIFLLNYYTVPWWPVARDKDKRITFCMNSTNIRMRGRFFTRFIFQNKANGNKNSLFFSLLWLLLQKRKRRRKRQWLPPFHSVIKWGRGYTIKLHCTKLNFLLQLHCTVRWH